MVTGASRVRYTRYYTLILANRPRSDKLAQCLDFDQMDGFLIKFRAKQTTPAILKVGTTPLIAI